MAKRLWLMFGALGVILLFCFGIAPAEHPSTVQAAAVPYQLGDIFAGVGDGHIYQYRLIGTTFTQVNDLNTATTSSDQTGMCVDTAGNLYATDFSVGEMTQFNNQGELLTHPWGGPFHTHPESCVVDAQGNIYTGEVDGTHDHIHKYSPAGQLLATYTPAADLRGIDWIDLAADQCTM